MDVFQNYATYLRTFGLFSQNIELMYDVLPLSFPAKHAGGIC